MFPSFHVVAGQVPNCKTVLGIDFDNTIVDYDDVFTSLAKDRGWVPSDWRSGKKATRDYLRAKPRGEFKWQCLQALAHGREIARARIFPGFVEFLKQCKGAGVQVCIVSHKSEYALRDPDKLPLREAARGWMHKNGFFSELGVSEAAVFFEQELAGKVRRIGNVGCEVFVDDLPEVFLYPGFPTDTRQLLFAPDSPPETEGGWEVFGNWNELSLKKVLACGNRL